MSHLLVDLVIRIGRPDQAILTPLDVLLWGFLNSKVYSTKPSTTHALKEEIELCIKEIQPRLCKKVMEKFEKIMSMYQQAVGAMKLSFNKLNNNFKEGYKCKRCAHRGVAAGWDFGGQNPPPPPGQGSWDD